MVIVLAIVLNALNSVNSTSLYQCANFVYAVCMEVTVQ